MITSRVLTDEVITVTVRQPRKALITSYI